MTKKSQRFAFLTCTMCWIVGGAIIAQIVPPTMEMARIVSFVIFCITSQFIVKNFIFKVQAP